MADQSDAADTGEPKGAKAAIERAADSLTGKITRTYIVPFLLVLIYFLGNQVWSDIREQGKDISAMAVNFAEITGRLNQHEWRLDRLEQQRKAGP